MSKMIKRSRLDSVVHQIEKAFTALWNTRDEIGDKWALPPTIDCLRFAVTEAGEALDQSLRKNGTYSRNNERDADELDELADCAFMLISALGRDYQRNLYPLIADSAECGLPDADDVVIAASMALFACKMEMSFAAVYNERAGGMDEREVETILDTINEKRLEWQERCARLLVEIAMIPYMTLGTRVDERMERIKERIRRREQEG